MLTSVKQNINTGDIREECIKKKNIKLMYVSSVEILTFFFHFSIKPETTNINSFFKNDSRTKKKQP